MVTVYEFLRMVVTDAQSRAEFTAEPRAFLDQAGLHELSNADAVHAASLALDHAPVEIVDEFTRALPPGLVALAAESHGAPLADLMPFLPNGPDDMESNMATPEIFTSLGDVEDMLQPTARTTDASTDDSGNSSSTSSSEDTTASDNQVGAPLGNGNEVGLVGDINTGDISGLAGGLNAGNVAGNGVTDVVGGLEDTVGGVQGGDLTGQLSDVAGAGDLTGGLQDLGGIDGGDVTGQLEDVTGALPVDDVAGGVAPMADLTAPLTGTEGPVGGVEGTVSDLTGGLGI